VSRDLPARRQPPEALLAQVAEQAARPASPLLAGLVDLLKDRFGEALAAVMLYGSCLHDDDPTEGLVDLYAIVDDYRSAYPSRMLRLVNGWMPPNVFYAQLEQGGTELRTKYAVLSLADLAAGTGSWFHPYVWARFAQPVRLLYARDAAAQSAVHESLARAVLRFLGEAAPLCDGGSVDVAGLWSAGLRRSYAAELRTEQGRARYLVERNLPDYERLTAAAAPALSELLEPLADGSYRCIAKPDVRRATLRAWRLRRWQGRVLSLLRLSKALFTFENGVEYAAWKIERHTGMSVPVTPRLRRYPLIFGWGVLWRLLRRGALR
jgi:hypothetical protein